MLSRLSSGSGPLWLQQQSFPSSSATLFYPLLLLPGDGGEAVEVEAPLLLAFSPLLRRTLASTCCGACSSAPATSLNHLECSEPTCPGACSIVSAVPISLMSDRSDLSHPHCQAKDLQVHSNQTKRKDRCRLLKDRYCTPIDLYCTPKDCRLLLRSPQDRCLTPKDR